MSTAYCHGCDRAFPTSSIEGKCSKCGSQSLSWSPRKHQTFYALSEYDRTFLRVQGIDPNDTEFNWNQK